MYIRNLIEDTCQNPNLQQEHGISFYIETENHKMLFDTGASGAFVKNADKLGIDLGKVDTVVISHGHYDHGGGIRSFLEINNSARIYIRKEAFGKFYSEKENRFHEVGLDLTLEHHPQIILVEEEDLQIDEELRLFAGVRERVLFPETNRVLLKEDAQGKRQADSFDHEQSLILRQGEEYTLFSGCSHCGILNIIERYEDIVGSKLKCVIGGFHLMNPSVGETVSHELIKEIAQHLMRRETTRYYTFHCTGQEAFAILHEMMGDQVVYISTGEEIH